MFESDDPELTANPLKQKREALPTSPPDEPFDKNPAFDVHCPNCGCRWFRTPDPRDMARKRCKNPECDTEFLWKPDL